MEANQICNFYRDHSEWLIDVLLPQGKRYFKGRYKLIIIMQPYAY